MWFYHDWATSWQNLPVSSEASDQPGHAPSLVIAFAVHMKKARVLSYPLSAQRRLIRLGGFVMRQLISSCMHYLSTNKIWIQEAKRFFQLAFKVQKAVILSKIMFSVFAKYQIVPVKAVVWVDFSVYALPMHWLISIISHFAKNIFFYPILLHAQVNIHVLNKSENTTQIVLKEKRLVTKDAHSSERTGLSLKAGV